MADRPKPRVLCVGAGSAPPDALREIMESAGYEVATSDAAQAVRRLADAAPEVVVVIAGAAEGPWQQVVDEARRQRSDEIFVPLLVLSPVGDVGTRISALRLGADECVEVGVQREELLARLEALLRIKGIQDRMAASRRELQRVSSVDGLTGLANRRHLQDRLKEELRRARRYHEVLSIILVDLDAFRSVADRQGEARANEVLKDVSRILLDAVREVDLVGRIGGDTFCVLLPNTHLAGALTVAERAWRAVGAHRTAGGAQVTCSVGLAFYPARGIGSADDLLRVAQEALYRAKREGRNRIGLYQAAHYLYEPADPDLDLG